MQWSGSNINVPFSNKNREDPDLSTDLGGLIFAGSDKVSAVWRQLQIGDLAEVGLFVGLNLRAVFSIKERDLAALVASDNLSSERSEGSDRGLGSNRREHVDGFRVLYIVSI
jgi:hypothetical protein